MEMVYHRPQPYQPYDQPQWSSDHESIHQDRGSNTTTPSQGGSAQYSRRPSSMKAEDDSPEYHGNVWYNRRHEVQLPLRHYTHPSMPVSHTVIHNPPYVRYDPNFVASYAHPHPTTWPMVQQDVNVPPTQPYTGQIDAYPPSTQYVAPQPFNFNQDPLSATSMSPQSSTGGWQSSTSTESAEQRAMLQSPRYQPVSPQLVARSDGIRKKNARFEIPRERNLQTIDAMILATTDEGEKKELKQQKRLLRNRQAALDSRQRKKTHTEKLELEKKVTDKKMTDLDALCVRLQEKLYQEREHWKSEMQKYEMALGQLQLEKDEMLRAKTNEAADLRRQNTLLKEHIRELETHGAGTAMSSMATDFNDFNVDDSDWEHEFSLVDGEDFKTEDMDSLQRQATPRPPPAPAAAAREPQLQVSTSKSDTSFSWNAFYMCLLFGAFIASSGNKSSGAYNVDTSQLPALSDEYRTEAGNVLKALVGGGSTGATAGDVTSARIQTSVTPRMTISGHELSQMSTSSHTRSNLDKLSATLVNPSREQEVRAAFSMSSASYNRIMDPTVGLDDDDDTDMPSSPPIGPIARAHARLEAEIRERERAVGVKNDIEERSVFDHKIPDKVLHDFHDFVRRANGQV